MTISVMRQQLIDKVIKLLAQAESTQFPAEAETFKRKAAELMAKHNIELSNTETLQDEFNDILLGEDEQYQRIMWSTLSKFTGCMLYINGKTLRTVGRHSDIDAFNYVVDVVKAQRERAAFTYLRTKGATKKNTIEFYLGFAIGLRKQVNELMTNMDNQVRQWGLVPIDPRKQATAWLESQVGKLVNSRKKSLGAFASEGYSAGRNATLNKGVSHSSARMQIAH